MSRRSEYDSYTDYEIPHAVSFDGQPYSYRDPDNLDYVSRTDDEIQWSNPEDLVNPNSYAMTNPLYAFSSGEINKAGQALGIKNINDKEEVDQMLEYLYKPTAMEEAKEDQIEEAVSTTPLTDELAQKGAPKSAELQAAQDNLQRTVDSIRDGTYVSSYRRRPSGTGVTGANESYSRQMLDTQMENATSGINIDNFSKGREQVNEEIQDDFTDKLYRDSESRFNVFA